MAGASLTWTSMIDLERHGRLLRRLVKDGAGRIVPACMRRMNEGRATYERPDFIDERDLLAEANDEILDAMNYPAMWAAKRGDGISDDPIVARYFRHLQSAHALLQMMRANDKL